MSIPIRPNVPTIAEVLPPDLVGQIVANKTAPLIKRAAELVEDCQAFIADYPEIADDDTDAIATEILGTIAPFITDRTGQVDRERIALKTPILAASEIIDGKRGVIGPFAAIQGRVEAAAAPIRRASINYKTAKNDRLRKAAAEEAERKAAEAAVTERMAARGSGGVSWEDVATAQQSAVTAAELALAKPAGFTRSHGDGVGVSSLKWKRTFVSEAPHLVPRSLCVPDPTKIRAYIGDAALVHNAADGWIELPDGAWGRRDIVGGCLVVNSPDLTIRK